MINRILAGAAFSLTAFAAQATPIRMEFETNIGTAFDYVTKATVPVTPITGKLAIEFDDANPQWGRDEWGPYFQFEMGWINTPVSANIPFAPFFAGYSESIPFRFTLGAGSISDAGNAYGYGPGYADQSFSFVQVLSSRGWDEGGLYRREYRLNIDFRRVSPIESFTPMSNIDFLRSFVGNDIAGGTATLSELYRFQRYSASGFTPYEGLRYMDGALKVTSVIDQTISVPEPDSISMALLGLAALVVVRRRRRAAQGEGQLFFDRRCSSNTTP